MYTNLHWNFGRNSKEDPVLPTQLTAMQEGALIDDLRYSLRADPIERRETVSPAEFAAEFEGGAGRPVIIGDAAATWPAREKWTFDFFRQQCGGDLVTVTDRLFGSKINHRVRLAEYLTYCQFPSMSPLAAVAATAEYPLYLTSYSPFAKHPELLDDFADPYYVDNIYRDLEGGLREWYLRGFSWIFIGPKGTLSPLHIDLFSTHAWLAQLQGRKHFLLFPPSDGPKLYNGAVNLYAPDLEKHPLLAEARPVEAILEPGDVIFIPAGWAHQVISLSPSISVTVNYVSRSNALRHVMTISRELPGWASKIDTPGFREAARIRWKSQGFVHDE